jgi:mRNA-degrading endonuclease toxin of MazEF toxin-antitoxin module
MPFTSVANPLVDTRVEVQPSAANGLDRPCFLEVDKLSAIRADWLGAPIGRLEDGPLAEALKLARELLSPPLQTPPASP